MLTVPNNMIAVIPLFEKDYYVKTAKVEILKSEISKGRCNQGIVKYVGRRVRTIRPGDYILFSGYTGSLVRLEKEGDLIFFPEDFALAKIDKVPTTEVNGLYFRTETGDFEPATYEIAMQFVGLAIQESDWFGQLAIKAERPKQSDYEEMQPSWG
jgi:hypothetical protein